MLMQFYVSIRDREKLRDKTGDPWGGRTLEWSTSSPPPDYNFAFTPVIHDSDAWWDMKNRGYKKPSAAIATSICPPTRAPGSSWPASASPAPWV
jgi:cytochrome o ubiquinol oxidase subunit 1